MANLPIPAPAQANDMALYIRDPNNLTRLDGQIELDRIHAYNERS